MTIQSRYDDYRLIIPGYNLEPYLSTLLDQVSEYFQSDHITVIDDGSTDRTATIAQSKGVNVIVHPTNLGKGVALKSGFESFLQGDGKWAMTIDGDLQHSPTHIPEFIRLANEGLCDVIIGTRLSKLENMPWDRRFSNLTTSKILSLITRCKILDSQCGFRLIRRNMVEELGRLTGKRFEFETECILEWAKRKARFGWVPIATKYEGSSSSIHRLKDTLLFLKVIAQHKR